MTPGALLLLTTAATTTTVACLAIPLLLHPDQTLHRLRKKRYQYEVTFGLYMLTPTEKCILNSFLFLTTSLITLATLLYLPAHLRSLSTKAWYYYSGGAYYPFGSLTEGVTARLQSAFRAEGVEGVVVKGVEELVGAVVGAMGAEVGAAAGEMMGAVSGGGEMGEMVGEEKEAKEEGERVG